MRSFLRQLNQYSFAKLHGTAATDYFHPRFVRGRRDLLNQVRRRAPGEPAVTAEALGGDESSHMNDGGEVGARRQPATARPTDRPSATKAVRNSARSPVTAKAATSRPPSKSSRKKIGSNAVAPAAEAGMGSAAGVGEKTPAAAVRTSGRAVRASAKAQEAAAAATVEIYEELGDEFSLNFVYEEGTADVVAVGKVGEEEEEEEEEENQEEPGGAAEGSFDRLVPAGGHHQRLPSFLVGGGGFRRDGSRALSDFSDFGLGPTDDFAAAFSEHDQQEGGGRAEDDGLLVPPSGPSPRDPTAAAAAAEFFLAPASCVIGAGPDFPPPPLPTAAAWAAVTAASAVVAAPTGDNATPPPQFAPPLISLARSAHAAPAALAEQLPVPLPLPPAAGAITGLGWRATSGASPATVSGLSSGGLRGLVTAAPFNLNGGLGYCAGPKYTTTALPTIAPKI
jgi:hypothetical protein